MAACGPTDDVSGLWRTPEGAAAVKLPGFPDKFEGKMEMGLGQYGRDVAGVIRFYGESIDSAHDLEECPCAYVDEGEVRSGTFTFSFTACGQTFTAALDLETEGDNDFLVGPLLPADAAADAEGTEIRLKNAGDTGEVRDERMEQGCVEP
jgi:hypothetical protein